MPSTTLLDAAFRVLSAMLHPPPVPPPAAETAPVAIDMSDEELAALADASGEVIDVTSDAPAESASSVHLDQATLRLRPLTQASDILRQVPGLAVSQHAGGGKSDQYFIRGFDADHGTDVAIFADGIPVNLTSHGHGQGYADTHWMIPETVASADMHKGPYAARYGDFYTAGALELKTIDNVSDSTVWIATSAPLGHSRRLDSYDRRLVGMASPRVRRNPDDKSLLAMQIAENDGPFLAEQDFRQGKGLAKWRGKAGPGELRLAATWYAGSWNQSGQLPEREVAAGRLDRFGSLDPTEGGIASRSSLQLGYSVRDSEARSTFRVMGYGVRNELELFSNFTLYARDVLDGDQIRQTDDRYAYGFDAGYERAVSVGGVDALFTIGAQARVDDVETSLAHTAQRRWLDMCFTTANPCNLTANEIETVATYVEGDIVPVAWLHVRPGVRVDRFQWRVTDLDPETMHDPMLTTSGDATAALVSPKLSFEAHGSDRVTFFLNTGTGFHSNDARAAVSGTGPLARALGAEAGIRLKPQERARVAADFWYLYLTSEQVWSGDAGGTEPSDPTRRFGFDLEGAVEISRAFALDANVTWARSTFVANQGNGGALALAPRWMGSGGASIRDTDKFASLRLRGIGDRPGTDDGSLTAQGYLLFDLVAGIEIRKLELNLTIANLLDAQWREAQFAEQSRVTPTGPIEEQMHFTPGIPRTATIKAAYRF